MSPPRNLQWRIGNQPASISSCSGTRNQYPSREQLSGVPDYSLHSPGTSSCVGGKSPGTVLLWLAPEVFGDEEPLIFVWFLSGSCLLLTWVLSA